MAYHPLRPHKRSLIGVHPTLDKAVYIAGIISLAMMFPQLKLIYMGKNAAGLEPITWLTLSLMDIPWIIYGIAHKEKPLIFIYTMWLIVNALIFVGAVIY
ncbi:MAG: hypothetical protein Q7R67_02580 [bacterium]|nr:hypothetical protein [bacterium]